MPRTRDPMVVNEIYVIPHLDVLLNRDAKQLHELAP